MLKSHDTSDNFAVFLDGIYRRIPAENVITKYIQRYAFGTDASFYRLTPKVVIRVQNVQQLQWVLQHCRACNLAVTFRAAGTSLSGQAISDSVLLILSEDWQEIQIDEQANWVKLQPGVIGAKANQRLKPFQRKIGPDPASINSCKIGGIAANNASGMCCGTAQNSYNTLRDMTLVFADGTVLDTADENARATFSVNNKKLIDGLMGLVEQVKSNKDLVALIRHKYRLKNTTGYGVNALVDFDDPIDIISHLMIGSEGTLAFIADITLQTIPIPSHISTGLYVLDDIALACELISQLDDISVSAVEIMDGRALHSVKGKLAHLNINQFGANCAALLIETSAISASQLSEQVAAIELLFSQNKSALLCQSSLTSDSEIVESLWSIRKGMFPAVGAVRETGTTVIIEDIAVPLTHLAATIDALHQLFEQYGYSEAIIFGHALSGNLHFVFTQSFETEQETRRYDQFMQSVTQLVAVQYQGSLKAEHGTGRNMAPFVETEWGEELYSVMKAIKRLFDPHNILNPGVLISEDCNAHLTHLKRIPAADEKVDKCIECGFCEPVCPSKNFTLTPRQRIAVLREISYLQRNDKLAPQLKELEKDFAFLGIDSCAATGLCAQSCPVDIDTGELVRALRANTADSQSMASFATHHFSGLTQIARFGLGGLSGLQTVAGEKVAQSAVNTVHRLFAKKLPRQLYPWPKPAVTLEKVATAKHQQKVVYVSSCANRVFAPENDSLPSINQVFLSLAEKAGLEVVLPTNIAQHCCGLPWDSKGYPKQALEMAGSLELLLEQASENGKWPVVMDASSCSLQLAKKLHLEVMDSIEFAARYLLPRLTVVAKEHAVMLHKTCSSVLQNNGKYLQEVAHACATEVIEPEGISCCGFAGDKGFTLPELNQSALKTLRGSIPQGCTQGYSNNRTCEIGLSHHAGIPYQSLLYLLDEVSQAR